MKGLLIANGEMKDPTFYGELLKREAYDWVVSADGGANKAFSMGIMPDWIVGDLDSIKPDVKSLYESKGVSFRTHPPAKDETDLELALHTLLEKGCRRIDLIGALGGRVDHQLGNIAVLVELAHRGVEGRILDEKQILRVLVDSKTLEVKKGNTISLLPMTPQVTNITLKGLEYPLNGETLIMGFARGISNVALMESIHIEFEEGILLVIEVSKGVD